MLYQLSYTPNKRTFCRIARADARGRRLYAGNSKITEFFKIFELAKVWFRWGGGFRLSFCKASRPCARLFPTGEGGVGRNVEIRQGRGWSSGAGLDRKSVV